MARSSVVATVDIGTMRPSRAFRNTLRRSPGSLIGLLVATMRIGTCLSSI